MSETVLDVRDLKMYFKIKNGSVHAVDGVTFTLKKGEALGIVGESGCGKTSLSMAILRLLPENARYVGGKIFFSRNEESVDLLRLEEAQMRHFRWREISIIFQAAMNSLNPVYRVASQVIEAMETHFPGLSREKMHQKTCELFELVGLDPDRMNRYPHEYSGGMKQRAVIAMALACNPRVVIADEPTTALDVIVQGRILAKLRGIQRDLGTSIIYISHDIAAIAQVSDKIAIMYAGKLVELADSNEIFTNPRHHYTAALMNAFPSITGSKRKLVAIDGEPPNLVTPPIGCRFAQRCPAAQKLCLEVEPEFESAADNHFLACHFPLEVSVRV